MTFVVILIETFYTLANHIVIHFIVLPVEQNEIIFFNNCHIMLFFKLKHQNQIQQKQYIADVAYAYKVIYKICSIKKTLLLPFDNKSTSELIDNNKITNDSMSIKLRILNECKFINTKSIERVK
jgi:hypothetical protein